jgi:3-oxoacyl-[acyl-carrier protein] reductase
VTGASRGIGAAIALELAQRGLKVIGTGTTEDGAAEDHLGARRLWRPGRALDVNDGAALEALVDEIVKTHGACTSWSTTPASRATCWPCA